jgi:hypothetical protein
LERGSHAAAAKNAAGRENGEQVRDNRRKENEQKKRNGSPRQ